MQNDSSVHPDSQYSLELWKPVPLHGFDKLYEVSSLGRVRASTNRKNMRAGDILSGKPHKKTGYCYVNITSVGGRRKHLLIHRLMMLAFDPIPNADDMDVNHIDGIKSHNILSNLEWMEHVDNIIHAHKVLKVGADNRGEKSGNAKLTDDNVREIRRLWDNGEGMQQTAIARMFGVSSVRISLIVRRKSWKHIE
jgi:hypothetical protein